MTTGLAFGQADVVAALETGRLTGGERPERIDTHISHIFLTPHRAWKLKRDIRLPFIDQSALETRRLLCEEELRVNTQLAPELYLGVRPIRRRGFSYSLDGDGEIVDWLVEMRRFPDNSLLDDIARHGALDTDLARRTGQRIARFHKAATPTDAMGHTADYRRIIRGLRATETDAAQMAGLDPATELFDQLDHALGHLDPLIEQRRRQGCVIRGHGDLHLRNICLWKGEPTPFDALEFDVRMATSDRLYDIAFLLMDLRHRHLHDAANAAMNTWWDTLCEDEEALALLPFFMALRAAIRMAVAVTNEDLPQASSYRRLALELLRPAPAWLIAVGGLSGVGKTAVSVAIAARAPGPCGARHLRTDILRKAGMDPNCTAPPAHYEPEMRDSVYLDLDIHAHKAIKAGASVVADATFQDHRQRRAIREAADDGNFCGVWLTASLDTRLARIAHRPKGPSDANADIARTQSAPENLGEGWTRISAEGEFEATRTRVMKQLDAAISHASIQPSRAG